MATMNKAEQTMYLTMTDLLHKKGHNMTESALKMILDIAENYHIKPKTLLAIHNLKILTINRKEIVDSMQLNI